MNYENFVTNYRRFTHCSRSLGEAYRTPEYACAITTFKSDEKKSMPWLFLALGIAFLIVLLIC